MKSFLESNLTTIKRIQFVLIVIVCTGVLISQIVQCVEKYMSRNTGTAEKYEHVSEIVFPEMTICPTYPYKLEVLQENGIAGTNNIQLGAQWISNDSRTSPRELYDDVTIPIDEIVHSVRFYLEQLLDGKNVIDLKPNDVVCKSERLFRAKPYYWNGNCYGLVMPSCYSKAGPLEVVIEFYDKTDIFIHHEGQFLSPNSRNRVDVDKGKFIKIAINHEVVQLLSDEDYGSCVDTFDPDPTYDDCMYSNLHRLMTEQVGCTVPWLRDKDKICDDPVKSKAAFNVYQQNRRNQDYICPKSCLFTNVYFGPPVTGNNDPVRSQYAWAVFYFRRDIKVTREYVLYTFLSLAAEVGAFVGLILGVSLVNLGTINSALLDLFFGPKSKKEEEKWARKVDVEPVMTIDKRRFEQY